jgi:hypothetical protein
MATNHRELTNKQRKHLADLIAQLRLRRGSGVTPSKDIGR